MSFEPTTQQLAIIEAASKGRSVAVYAAAGAAKTTTIKLLAPSLPKGKVLAVAFNKRIALDLQDALPKGIRAGTLNALGHRAWSTMRNKRLELEQYKMSDLIRQGVREAGLHDADEDGSFARYLTGIADWLRQSNSVPPNCPKRPIWIDLEWSFAMGQWRADPFDYEDLTDIDTCEAIVTEALNKSIELAFQGTVDFLDQIYMTTSFPAAYEHYDTVIVDEAQDLSPANHRQLMLMKPKQLIAVGDPKQAIYAFRGADAQSMDSLRGLWDTTYGRDDYGLPTSKLMEMLPLSTSFRCPKAVVERQKAHYPEMEAFESNPEGTITRLDKWDLSMIPFGSAVICRNTSPLVSFAFLCLSNGRGFSFLGVDMAKNLKSLIKKIAGFAGKNLTKNQKAMPQASVLDKLELWFLNEKAQLQRKGRLDLEAALRDRKECAFVVISKSENLGEALDLCDTIFSSSEPGLTLTTGHRSKGFEWDHVWHLDFWRIPSKYAKEAAELGDFSQLTQEKNLRYVIETRAKQTLSFISLQDNADAKGLLDEEA